jgi:hypothetical protein
MSLCIRVCIDGLGQLLRALLFETRRHSSFKSMPMLSHVGFKDKTSVGGGRFFTGCFAFWGTEIPKISWERLQNLRVFTLAAARLSTAVSDAAFGRAVALVYVRL